MSTQGTYNHHGAWNNGNNASGLTNTSLPGDVGPQTAIGQIVVYSFGAANASSLNTISFEAEAGQIYAIWLGGYRNGGWGDITDDYQLTISQMPVPATVWLFGSALTGFVGISRRKRKLAA